MISGATALSAVPSVPVHVDILGRESVAILAVSSRQLPGAVNGSAGRSFVSAVDVNHMCDRFQMARVDAATNPAQMVKFKPLRDWANSIFVDDSVNHPQPIGSPDLTVATTIKTAHPNPAFGFGDDQRPGQDSGSYLRKSHTDILPRKGENK